MDLALNNLRRLICHLQTNRLTSFPNRFSVPHPEQNIFWAMIFPRPKHSKFFYSFCCKFVAWRTSNKLSAVWFSETEFTFIAKKIKKEILTFYLAKCIVIFKMVWPNLSYMYDPNFLICNVHICFMTVRTYSHWNVCLFYNFVSPRLSLYLP